MRILVVDDNRSSADALARALTKQGDEASALYDGQAAIGAMSASDYDVVLTDLKMEPVSGMEVLRAARDQRPPPNVIVFTAYGAIETAVEAMQLGAHDFLTKPVSLDQILARINDLRAPAELDLPDDAIENTEPGSAPFHTESPASRDLFDTLSRVAGVPSHIWLEGEIGCGRGHAALTIHRLSTTPQAPFVTIDIARFHGWPESGTALIPNVDDLPDDLQRDLIRQLQHLPEDVRVVSTAAPGGRSRIAEGSLRPELYYQLGVIVIGVPPLRERAEDIVPMMRDALKRYADRYKRGVPTLSADQEDALKRHAWPGNIRELFNIAERATVLGPEALNLDVVRPASSPDMPRLEPGFNLATHLETIERRILVEALRRTRGDRAEAGRLLGVERNTLRYKLNKYDLLDR